MTNIYHQSGMPKESIFLVYVLNLLENKILFLKNKKVKIIYKIEFKNKEKGKL